MAYPEIDQPMYELLKEISPDYIIPNLHKLPENSATVMKVNMRFLESLFVGLNHEMSRELLWREYPTDQRGSYIRTFWDKSDSIGTPTEENNYDINNELHAWNAGLGDNNESEISYLVLVLRGKLLQKFPDTVIFAQQAEFVNPLTGTPTQQQIKDAPRKLKTNGLSIFPEFTAKLGTDVTLVAFNMTRQTALGQNGDGDYLASDAGYYFALQERPGQLRFGADAAESLDYNSWDNLHWGQMGTAQILNTLTLIEQPNENYFSIWGKSSADMATILTQLPVLFLVHSKDMIS